MRQYIPIAFVLLLGVAGCSSRLPDEPERVTVLGTVNYLGKPLPDGNIMFRPINGTKGPVSGASILNGAYKVDHKGGVPVGEHRVEITARGRDPNAIDDPFGGGPPTMQYIPDKYNLESELTITVNSDSDEITKSFDLE